MSLSHPHDELARHDRAHLLHPFTSVAAQQAGGPLVMRRGRGVWLWDDQGREYLDGMAGLWCVNIGYGREEMARAMAEQTRELSYYHSFMGMANAPSIQLAHRLAAMTPGPLGRVFFANSGSEANDTLVKLVWTVNNLRGQPRRKKFITRRGAYHGVTVASGSLSGLDPLHAHFDLPRPGFLHTRKPHPYWEAKPGEDETAFSNRLAGELDALIEQEGPDTIAAFVAEPVMGAGGVVPPPKGYFEAITPVLKQHGIWFCADEVISGFGRLGTWFGSDYFGLTPDFMTLAKGLTSGYVPLSALVISEEVWEVLREASPRTGPFAHGFTYSGHPLSCAAALKNLDILEEDNLVQNATRVGAWFQDRLRRAVADHPLVGEVRGLGLIAGVELVRCKENKTPFDPALGVGQRLAALLLEEGLICRPIGNTLAFSPPLVITQQEAEEMVDRFTSGLHVLRNDLVKEGLWRRG